jgi:hypothetical protein
LTAKMLRPVAAAAPARGRCRGRPAGGSAGPGACSREPGGEARTPGAGSGVIGGRARVRRPAGCLGHAGWHLAAGDDRGRGRVREQKATNPAGRRVCCCLGLGLGRALDCARPGAGRRAAELATRSSLQAQGGVSALLVDHAQEAGLAREEREGDTKELAIPILQRLLYSFSPLAGFAFAVLPNSWPADVTGGRWVGFARRSGRCTGRSGRGGVAWISWQPGRAAGVACAAAAAAAAWHCRAVRRGAYMHAPSYEPAGYVLIQSYEREREGHTSNTY